MHAIYVRNLDSRRPGILLAVDIEDAALAERLVRSIAGSYPAHGRDEAAKACWFRDAQGLHAIWSEPARGVARRSYRASSKPQARPHRHHSSAA